MGKRYNCLYCSERMEREDLVGHIDEEHSNELPEGFSPSRVTFNIVNKKPLNAGGVCVVCKKQTRWDENSNKYKRLCENPKCLSVLREKAVKNMIKIHGVSTLLTDENHQAKMLANRGISGKYKFETDGGYHVYTGSYEKKLQEFSDSVLGFKSSDFLFPGPVFEYEYEGKVHKWITDCLLIPFNLIIEVKDGGSNPNNRQMDSYREKQLAKESMITSMGKFNYLRLTDNDFSQLLETLASLKSQMIDDSDENKKVIININEEVEFLREGLFSSNHKEEKDEDVFYSKDGRNLPYPYSNCYHEAEKIYNSNKKKDYSVLHMIVDLFFFNYTEDMCKKIARNQFRFYHIGNMFNDQDDPSIKEGKEFFKDKKFGMFLDSDGYGFVYCEDTNKFYWYDHEDVPQIDYKKPISYSQIMNESKSWYGREIEYQEDVLKAIYNSKEYKEAMKDKDQEFITKENKKIMKKIQILYGDQIRAERSNKHNGNRYTTNKIILDTAKKKKAFLISSVITLLLLPLLGPLAAGVGYVSYHDILKNKSYKESFEEFVLDEDTDNFLEVLEEAVRLQKVSEKDWKDIVTIHDSLTPQEKKFLGGRFINSPNTAFTKVYREGSTPVAFVQGYDFNRGELILELAVASYARGKGYGSRCVSDCIGFARREKYKKVVYLVKQNNTASIALARKAGFKYDAKERNHFVFVFPLEKEGTVHEAVTKKFDTPEDLLSWMKENISYGYKRKDGSIHKGYLSSNKDKNDFYDNYKLQSPQELMKSKYGVCWDQAELQRYVFSKMGIENEVIYMISDIPPNYPTHTFSIIKKESKYYWFENSWSKHEGIHGPFKSKQDIINLVHKMSAEEDGKESEWDAGVIRKPKYGMSCQEFMDFANSSVNHELIGEASIIPDDDIYYNIDKFENGINNILFVVGLSGGGKSTISNSLAEKYNCEKIELDILSGYNIKGEDVNFDKKIDEWYKKLCLTYSGMSKGEFKNFIIDNGYIHRDNLNNGWSKVCEKIFNYIKSLKGTYIAEGIQPLFIEDLNTLKDQSLIVIETTVLKSTVRASIRDSKKYESAFEKITKFCRNLYRIGKFNHKTDTNQLSDLRSIITDESFEENMALGMMNPIPPNANTFVTQFSHRNGKSTTDAVEGYAIHNDIVTDKVLVVDKNSGKLRVKEASYLEGRKLRMFKYIGENSIGYSKILQSVDRKVYREYLYETLTNKKLLSDDQIICDECFQEISPTRLFEEYSSIAQTIIDQYKEIIGEEVIRLPLMNNEDIQEASKLLEGNSNIKVFENMNGYFAENALSRERTGYYKKVSDIQIGVIL